MSSAIDRIEEIRRKLHGLQMLMVVRPYYDVSIVAEHRDLVRERNALIRAKVVA